MTLIINLQRQGVSFSLFQVNTSQFPMKLQFFIKYLFLYSLPKFSKGGPLSSEMAKHLVLFRSAFLEHPQKNPIT